ncbi:MAG: hypothetical protein IID44_17190, partial [Planctomycetes bacterium]|nr:hypothetical protein [Planctomycetota bacterium]
LVRLTTKTADALTVRVSMSPIGDEGAEQPEHYLADQSITIRADEKVGRIPVTFFDDGQIEPSRRFEVRIVSAEYPDGLFQAPDPIIENIEGRITIVDDDTPPTGPPVLIGITPVGGAQLDGPIVNGQPILAHISENAGPLSFELAPLSLQRADSVQVRARVFRVAGSDPVSEDFLGAGAVFAEQIVLLQGPRPLLLSFPLIDDAAAELHETFRVQFDVLQEARFAPSTSLQTDSALVTVRNDDPERPADAIVFYNFDGEAVPIIIPGEGLVGVDYAFTEAADFTDPILFATNFALSSGPVEAAAGLPKLEPSALPDDETPAAGAAAWDAQLAGPNLLQNGGAESGARGDTSAFSSISAWVETAGDWNNRLFNDPEPATGNDLFSAGRITTSSRDGLNVLTQTVSLADFSGRIQNVEQGFRLSGQIFVDKAVGQIAVDFLDSFGRIIGTETTEEIRVSADWVVVSARGIVPLGTTAARIKLLATKTTAPTGTVPVYFDDVAFQLTDPEYFQFELTLDDAARTLENPEDFRSALAIELAGVDFWDLGIGAKRNALVVWPDRVRCASRRRHRPGAGGRLNRATEIPHRPAGARHGEPDRKLFCRANRTGLGIGRPIGLHSLGCPPPLDGRRGSPVGPGDRSGDRKSYRITIGGRGRRATRRCLGPACQPVKPATGIHRPGGRREFPGRHGPRGAGGQLVDARRRAIRRSG